VRKKRVGKVEGSTKEGDEHILGYYFKGMNLFVCLVVDLDTLLLY